MRTVAIVVLVVLLVVIECGYIVWLRKRRRELRANETPQQRHRRHMLGLALSPLILLIAYFRWEMITHH